MLPEDGVVVAPPDISPGRWLQTLHEKTPVVLAPGSSGGWFGGKAVVAWSPECLVEGLGVREAAATLQGAFEARSPCMAIALLPYDGAATVAHYTGGLVLTAEGWRVWGALRAGDVVVPEDDSATLLPSECALARCLTDDMSGAAFRRAVHAVGEAIARGDVYVLNLTHRLRGLPTVEPETAFRSLLARTHAEMAAFWRTPGLTVASASPERFIRIAGDRVEVCPVKGTRPRADGAEDALMAEELGSSEKERAEHVMIVDLERNDIGRVCRPGTVSVAPLLKVVSTPYCHQMVSTVSGQLLAEAELGDVLESAFPCGSVTGAPKIAAMRAIDAMEASSRHAYTGSLVVAVPGELDSSVLIRTAEYAGSAVRWGIGGGITIDSDPAEEWLETLLKASPFLGDGHPSEPLRETCRVVYGKLPLLSRHLARLAAGGCGPSTLARVRSAVSESTAGCAEVQYARLAVTVESCGHVTAVLTQTPSSLDVPGGPTYAAVLCEPRRLPAGAAKPADRGAWDDAQTQAAAAGADQAVLVDADGFVVDGATASVWARIGDRLLTPVAPLAVAGVGRGVVLDHVGRCGYAVEETRMPIEVLSSADEVFFSNAVAGVVAARGRGGPATDALRVVFRGLFGLNEYRE